MKIHQQQANGISADRSERSGPLGRIDSDNSTNGSRQVGLDHVEVSRVGKTAAALIEHTMQQRRERVSALAAEFQEGTYHLNLANLSQSILDYDSEIDPAYAR
jgi:anti-sigma28 factor (negative regulator of flagellin synthesis)